GGEQLVVKEVSSLREIDVYRDLLGDADLGTPRLHAAAGRWLALERVDGVPLEGVGGFAGWEAALRWLARMACRLTLGHRDLYPANIRVAGERICVLDWELAHSGDRALDVASLSTGWSRAEQELLVAAYREALASPPPADDLASDVKAARLVIAQRF